MPGNWHVLFGKGPTEKARVTGTSPAAYFTRREAVGKGPCSRDLAGGPPNANVGELLERVLTSQRTALRQAAAAVDRTLAEAIPPETETRLAALATPPGQTHAQEQQQSRRAQRLARYEAVLALHQQGFSQVAISKQVGLGRKTVRRYLRSDARGCSERFVSWDTTTVPELCRSSSSASSKTRQPRRRQRHRPAQW